jgi:hypothetical protein
MFGVTFVEFFNNREQAISSGIDPSPLELEFIQLAKELFEEFIPVPNAIYKFKNLDIIADNSKPWEVSSGSIYSQSVRILYIPSEIENRRYSKYRADLEVPTGAIKVLMQDEGLTVKIRDLIEFKGKLWKINTIDKIGPMGTDILNVLTLGL